MLALILIIAALLRLVGLNQSFWLDEAAQAVLSSKPIWEVNYGVDFQPPFFYIFSHFWLGFGVESEWFLRLPSVSFAVLNVYATYVLFLKIFDKKTGLTAALLLAISSYHIYYSQELRMYSLFSLLITISWIFLWEKKWFWYGAVIAISVFTHYFAFLAIISQLTYIVVVKRTMTTKFMKTLVFALTPFLTWLPTVFKQLQTAKQLISAWPDWSRVSGIPFLKFAPLVLAKFTVGFASPENKLFYAFCVLLFGSILGLSLYRLFRRQIQPPGLALACCFALVPLLLAVILGLFISVNSPHRLIFILPGVYGIIAAGLVYKKSPLATGECLVITLLILLNGYFSLTYLTNPKYHREDWRRAVAYTDSKAKKGSLILTESNIPWVPIDWYSKQRSHYSGASTTMNVASESVEQALDAELRQCRLPFGKCDLALYTYLFELSDPQKEVEKYLISHQYRVVEEKDFQGVGIIKIFRKNPI